MKGPLEGDQRMSTNKATTGAPGASRNERRTAERASRKGGVAARTATRSTGPSVGAISGAAIVVGLIAVIGFIAVSGGLGGDDVDAVSMPADPPPSEELHDGRSLGDPAAPVKVDVYEDPQCPACGIYSQLIEPLLVAGPVARGQVRYTYHDLVFLGPESLEAAAAMRVAEELDGRFWDLHHVLYHNQHGENEGAFSTQRLADMAELVGLDREAFLAGLDDPRHEEAVRAESAEASQRGIDSTPTLVVNGEVIRGVPRSWEDLDRRIEAAAEEAQGEA